MQHFNSSGQFFQSVILDSFLREVMMSDDNMHLASFAQTEEEKEHNNWHLLVEIEDDSLTVPITYAGIPIVTKVSRAPRLAIAPVIQR